MLIKSSVTPLFKRNAPSKRRFINGSIITINTPKINEAAKAFNLITSVNSSSILFLVIDKINNEIKKSDFEIVFVTSLSVVIISETKRRIKQRVASIIPNAIFLKYLGNRRNSI